MHKCLCKLIQSASESIVNGGEINMKLNFELAVVSS